nr:hypothetical protein [Armatimonadota bacterium]
ALHGLMHLPYALQLAHGWTKLAFYQNLVAVCIMAPLLLFVTNRWGSLGAAGAWVLLNIGTTLVGIQVMHRRLLKNEKWQWYTQDVGLPLLGCLITASVTRWLVPIGGPAWLKLIEIALCLAATVAGSVSLTPLRHNILRRFI